FARVPPGQVKRVEAMTPETRKKFFADWLKERLAKTDAIHVLISKQPAHIEIGLGDAIQQKAFTPSNRDQLHALVLDTFKAKQFDQGLLKAVEFIALTLAQNSGTLAVKDGAGVFKAAALLA